MYILPPLVFAKAIIYFLISFVNSIFNSVYSSSMYILSRHLNYSIYSFKNNINIFGHFSVTFWSLYILNQGKTNYF